MFIFTAPDFHSSMIDISRPTSNKHQSNGATKMADPFEKVKKKKGLFSFLSRKDKSKSVSQSVLIRVRIKLIRDKAAVVTQIFVNNPS